ncbi:MAG: 4,5-DOPA dioxygenase extradiol [Gammaproteobacteria bacterium]|nr:4,5-DOPA dioxygenase extradiol [Gammaproteobacteria bacterium]
MPVIFIGHGSPTNALETNDATRGWSRIAGAIRRPRAILCISAHWCTRGTAVTAMAAPRTIHDFGPLSPRLFEIRYPAPGSPELAGRVRDLLAPDAVTLDTSWGLDHGTWAVLLKAYPEADIPVVQLSMDITRPPQWHVEMGARLQPLRDEGILILGSGNIVHNLSLLNWDPESKPYDWAQRFNERIKECIVRNDSMTICGYQDLGSDAVLAAPNPDHFWPLLYVLGARRVEDAVTFTTDFIQYRSLGMTSACFSAPPLVV